MFIHVYTRWCVCFLFRRKGQVLLRYRWGFVAQQAKTKPETLVIKLASDEIEPESRWFAVCIQQTCIERPQFDLEHSNQKHLHIYIFHGPLLILFHAFCTFMLIIYCTSLFLTLINCDCYDFEGTKRQIVQYNGICEDLLWLPWLRCSRLNMTCKCFRFIA